MPYVRIDIDMDEFDTDDILNELLTRKDFSNNDKARLYKFARTLLDGAIPIKHTGKMTLLDKMKWETISEHIEKKTLEEIQSFFD